MYYDPTDFNDLKEIERILIAGKPYSIRTLYKRMRHKKKWEQPGKAPFSDLPLLLHKVIED